MTDRRGPLHWRAGPRLPIADPEPKRERCDRNPAHWGGIRFELHRYGRNVGVIRLCEVCIRDLILVPDPDPTQLAETAA